MWWVYINQDIILTRDRSVFRNLYFVKYHEKWIGTAKH